MVHSEMGWGDVIIHRENVNNHNMWKRIACPIPCIPWGNRVLPLGCIQKELLIINTKDSIGSYSSALPT